MNSIRTYKRSSSRTSSKHSKTFKRTRTSASPRKLNSPKALITQPESFLFQKFASTVEERILQPRRRAGVLNAFNEKKLKKFRQENMDPFEKEVQYYQKDADYNCDCDICSEYEINLK